MSKESQSQSPQVAADAPDAPARTQTAARRRTHSRKLPPYNVVLLNDDDHTYEYVIEMMKVLFSHPVEMGFTLAKELDETGKVIVFTTHRELAELKRDQIHAYGTDLAVATCAGSMSAMVEPAEG